MTELGILGIVICWLFCYTPKAGRFISNPISSLWADE